MTQRDVLELGMRWRVCLGDRINIWTNPWLLGHYSYRVVSPVHELSSDATVNSLIDHTTMSWNTSLLDKAFFFFFLRERERANPTNLAKPMSSR